MTRMVQTTALVATALLAAACGDTLSGNKVPVTSDAITAAFSTVPLGFSSTTSSYAGDGEGGPSHVGKVGLAVVIDEVGGTKSCWALAHPPGAPDFHHPTCFAAELPAPDEL